MQFRPVLLLALPFVLVAGDIAAQPAIRPNQQQGPQAPGLAPALPGLATRRPPAPIPAENAENLSPNAALFDAINRGDLAAARAAIGRGADLNARNALGLSPLDAAVDQSRHEIAFYLLSARDLAPAGAPPPPGPGGLDSPPLNAAPRAQRLPAQPAPSRAAATTVPRNPRLWANDGGAPQPSIGFLGFDAGRPAGEGPPSARRAGRG